MIEDLSSLVTETRSPYHDLDALSVEEILTIINGEDRRVAEAVAKELPNIAKVVKAIVAAFAQGGRLIYVGAGTSGRLGVLDASECPPTFGVPPEQVDAIIAGGDTALRHSSEEAEDDAEQGARDLRARGRDGQGCSRRHCGKRPDAVRDRRAGRRRPALAPVPWRSSAIPTRPWRPSLK